MDEALREPGVWTSRIWGYELLEEPRDRSDLARGAFPILPFLCPLQPLLHPSLHEIPVQIWAGMRVAAECVSITCYP